jgi:hypothetical protein
MLCKFLLKKIKKGVSFLMDNMDNYLDYKILKGGYTYG